MPEDQPQPIRIAMWSGPRNISTALMRSWSSRADTAVIDEPLYAHYLSTLDPAKRAAHPGADAVLAAQPADWRAVAATLTGPVPRGKAVWYQKHMAHHLTPEMEREMEDELDRGNDARAWIRSLISVFLIRDPAAMITSFIKVIDNPTPSDLGLPQQVRLFDRLHARFGSPPPVFDAADILKDPETGLAAMCAAVGVDFDPAMLSWAEGPHPDDGVWAPHWYASVNASTGFAPYAPKNEPVPDRLAGVLRECQRLYDHLAQFRTMG